MPYPLPDYSHLISAQVSTGSVTVYTVQVSSCIRSSTKSGYHRNTFECTLQEICKLLHSCHVHNKISFSINLNY